MVSFEREGADMDARYAAWVLGRAVLNADFNAWAREIYGDAAIDGEVEKERHRESVVSPMACHTRELFIKYMQALHEANARSKPPRRNPLPNATTTSDAVVADLRDWTDKPSRRSDAKEDSLQ
jgi:hypothetical protein